jgi:hypothetical protein
MRVEHEYRRGALQYLAAWDCHRAKIFGRCEPKNGIVPFDRLVAQVMDAEPYASARRVFWVVDNGSSHRGERSIQRLEGRYTDELGELASLNVLALDCKALPLCEPGPDHRVPIIVPIMAHRIISISLETPRILSRPT